MRCPMCRTPLEQSTQESACKGCPLYMLKDGCYLELVLCPQCGYHSLPAELEEGNQIPALSTESIRHSLPDGIICCTLAELSVGLPARLVEFNGLTGSAVQRLASFGLVPGVLVEVCQRFPATILKFHETELALENSIAASIFVAPLFSASRRSGHRSR